MATAGRLKPLEEFSQHLATFSDVDQLVRYATRRTRELLDAEGCAVSLLDRETAHLTAPLATRTGHVGVIEVVGPKRGYFTADDRKVLEILASDIAVACQPMLECEPVGGDVAKVRWLGTAVGFGLAAVGLLFVLGAVLVHLSLALPVSELPARPAMRPGLVLLLVGGLLARVCRGVSRSSAVRKPEPAAPAVPERGSTHVDGLGMGVAATPSEP